VMRYNLIASVGFMFDTSLAVSRMIFDGFFDRHPNLKLIASHGGGALPYIAGRLDICYDNMPACRERISRKPSTYLKQIYYDSVVFQQESLELALKVGGDTNVLYGSDYPHNIGDMKGCLSRVDALPAAQRDAVRGANAMRIFRL
jgi:aminocarboxymuconate-semialdehyde decarboxylase